MSIESNYAASITMDLENLQKKYSNVLIQYKQASTDYINYLNSRSENPCSKYSIDQRGVDDKCLQYIWSKSGCTTTGFLETINKDNYMSSLELLIISFFASIFPDNKVREKCYDKTTNYSKATGPNFDLIRQPLVTIDNSSYSGSGSAGELSVGNVDECKVFCAANPKCTGATFVSGKCNLRTGDSDIVPAENSVAIVSKSKQLLMNMDKLNRELMDINNQIKSKISAGNPLYSTFNNDNNIKSEELIKQYDALNKERNNIQTLLDKYDNLDLVQNENLLILNQNYFIYIILFILACFFIYLLIKVSYSGTSISQYRGQYRGQFGLNVI